MKRHLHLVLLGATVDAYALAASFYEDYGVRATVADETLSPLFFRSRVCRAYAVPHLSDGRIFLRALGDLYEGNDGRVLLLIPMTAHYAALVTEHASSLSKMFVLPGGFSTPEIFCDDTPRPYPDAVLFCYVGREGERRLTYAPVVGYDRDGAPAALVTEHTPHELLELMHSVEGLPRGFFLLYVYAEGDECVLTPASHYPSLLRFPLAADHSLPEYLLKDYVLFQPLPDVTETPQGLYCASSILGIRFCADARDTVRRLRRAGLTVSLYNGKTERHSLRARLAFLRLLRGERP